MYFINLMGLMIAADEEHWLAEKSSCGSITLPGSLSLADRIQDQTRGGRERTEGLILHGGFDEFTFCCHTLPARDPLHPSLERKLCRKISILMRCCTVFAHDVLVKELQIDLTKGKL